MKAVFCRIVSRFVPALALVAAASAAVACGEERKSEPIKGPIQLSPAEARGRIVFMKHCNECHPQGEAGLGPALNSVDLPGPLIESKVRDKTALMPNFSDAQISDDDLDKLVAYLVKLRNHGE